MEVRKVETKMCDDLILNVHYAHRKPSISFAYGLFENNELIGCCTYGTPASSSLLKGVCGVEYIGEDFYLKERSRKHRYIKFLGSKVERKKCLKH